MKHSFSIILTSCLLMIIGIALFPYVEITDAPRPTQGKTLSVTYSWPGVAAKVVEQNVTSRLEAMVSAVKGVEKVSSVSYYGNGAITITLKKGADVSATKFEIASLLRQVRNKLPENVSHPLLTGGEVDAGMDDEQQRLILTYQANANMSPQQIAQIVERTLKYRMETVPGVDKLLISGITDRYLEITYNAQAMGIYGIAGEDIAEAVRAYEGREDIVGEVTMKNGRLLAPLMLYSQSDIASFEEMPVKTVGGKIIYLNQLAQCTIRDKQPDSYFRVNGKNTLYVNVYVERGANVVSTARRVKAIMPSEEAQVNYTLSYDKGEQQIKEFRTLAYRTLAAILALLFLAWIVSGRQWRYLFIVATALTANVLIAIILYALLGIQLHPMSMAGITVSLGLTIDSTIVMADHFSYYHDRKAIMSIIAAMLTTIGALVVVFWLPEHLRTDLRDFSIVVMVNLAVAILVSWLFVPALVTWLRYGSRQSGRPRRLRTARLFSTAYRRYVSFASRRLGKAITLGLLTGAFGWSLHTFVENRSDRAFQRQKEEMHLHIRAQMPIGGSIRELNEKVQMLEAYLAQYAPKIRRYETRINQGGAHIDIQFTPEALAEAFPFVLESRVIGKVVTIGGADWATFGVSERGFSNALNLQYRAHRIGVKGYDYDRLMGYAVRMMHKMGKNPRVVDLSVETPKHEFQEDEYHVEYDRQMLSATHLHPSMIHHTLSGLLSQRGAGQVKLQSGDAIDVVVRPADADSFDLWHLQNSFLESDSREVRPSDLMKIERRKANNCIPRENQEYVLNVAFNVLGSYAYSSRIIEEAVDSCNATLPVGFKCENEHYSYYPDTGEEYWLIGLVALIIFFICSILFESLWQAFCIILLIPFSFIGLFLAYHLTDCPFGSGGFAAMVMLSGLTVNAGIYIFAEYNALRGYHPVRSEGLERTKERALLMAVNHKIVPILLTIISTLVGLVPFLIDTGTEPFWQSLAIGTIGGLAISIIILLVYLPAVLVAKHGRLLKDYVSH